MSEDRYFRHQVQQRPGIGPAAYCGRGLTVVAALSSRWGCERTGHRLKVVWAELLLFPEEDR